MWTSVWKLFRIASLFQFWIYALRHSFVNFSHSSVKKHTKYFFYLSWSSTNRKVRKSNIKRSRNWNEKKGKENKRTNKQIEYEKFSKEATTSPLVVVRATIANNFCISHTFLSRSWTETTPFVKIVSWRSELKQFKSLKRTRKIFKFYQKNNLRIFCFESAKTCNFYLWKTIEEINHLTRGKYFTFICL